jgi:hypothetical protein
MDRYLFHALIQDAPTATIPADPGVGTDVLGPRFVKGIFYFEVTVPMDTLPRFLETSKRLKLDASLIGLCRRHSFEWVRNALSGSIFSVCLMVRLQSPERYRCYYDNAYNGEICMLPGIGSTVRGDSWKYANAICSRFASGERAKLDVQKAVVLQSGELSPHLTSFCYGNQ